MEGRRKHAWVATEVGNENGLNDRVRRLMATSARLTGIRLSFAFVTLLVCVSSLLVLPVARLESKRNDNGDEKRAQQQTALTNYAQVEMGPAKEQANKPASLSTRDSRLVSEVQDRPQESTPAQTTPDANVEDGEAASPIAASTATGNANTIQPVPDLQIEILKSQMAALGYKDLTAKQLADMRAYAVGPAYVAEMAASGYSGLSADMLIRFKWIGVSSSYIREMRALGYDNLSPQMLVNFRHVAVSPDYIRQMRSRISGSISSEQLVALRLYGASTEFVDKLKGRGYANLNANQLISMRLQGVSIAFIEDLQAKGHKSLSADDVIGIRMRGSN